MALLDLFMPLRGSVFANLEKALRRSHAVARQRVALSQLDDDALRDIGITRAEAEAEAARPFWDSPNHWHR